jgi:hypothetical protein
MMGKLSSRRRQQLPASAFAYPKQRKYPIDTPARARNALARAAQKGTSGSYRHVARAVKRRYGSKVATVGGPRGTTSRRGYRKGRRSRR